MSNRRPLRRRMGKYGSVSRELERLEGAVQDALDVLPEDKVPLVRDLLRQTVASVTTVTSNARSAPSFSDTSRGVTDRYFPVSDSPINRSVPAEEMALANQRWDSARQRGAINWPEAMAAIGPLLTIDDVSERLGVSRDVVDAWSRQNRLLRIPVDDRSSGYPEWQFTQAPPGDVSGILPHLADVLSALGDIHGWDKARFLLSAIPGSDGRNPLELLRQGREKDVERVLQLAERYGETGS